MEEMLLDETGREDGRLGGISEKVPTETILRTMGRFS
jgi:hypothetical protein